MRDYEAILTEPEVAAATVDPELSVDALAESHEALRELLAYAADDDECTYDHHGQCQTHWMADPPEHSCLMPRILAVTALVREGWEE